MEYRITIEINNNVKQITLKPALYKDVPLWEITLEGKNHIVRKSDNGWEQSTDGALDADVLSKIGNAIEYLKIKDAS